MKKGQQPPPQLFFKEGEIKAVVLGLQTLEEDISKIQHDPQYNFTPEARSIMADMITQTRSALNKLARVVNGGKPFDKIPPFRPGDEDEFLTKES